MLWYFEKIIRKGGHFPSRSICLSLFLFSPYLLCVSLFFFPFSLPFSVSRPLAPAPGEMKQVEESALERVSHSWTKEPLLDQFLEVGARVLLGSRPRCESDGHERSAD